jgi:hypothetical protein
MLADEDVPLNYSSIFFFHKNIGWWYQSIRWPVLVAQELKQKDHYNSEHAQFVFFGNTTQSRLLVTLFPGYIKAEQTHKKTVIILFYHVPNLCQVNFPAGKLLVLSCSLL